MRIIKAIIIFAIAVLSIGVQGQRLTVIPYPTTLEQQDGQFKLNENTIITHDGNLEFRAKQLKAYLDPATGFDLKIGLAKKKDQQIALKLNNELTDLGNEGYTIEVKQNKILIEALHPNGIFYALQTLRQLLPKDIFRHAKTDVVAWNIPACRIIDNPEYAWRGLMIDYSRTFWNKRITRKYIDALALYKMNKLHMHLTDDQGWRLEIKKYPKLTEIASKFHPSFNEPKEREGYYTQDDIKELIAYAAARNVEIIPEIELPGHSAEVFAVYPELSCKGDTFKIHPFKSGPGIHKEIFCAGNDETFVFLKDVLTEVSELFPSKYIHIGGDEAPKNHWKECDKCQQRIKEEGLHDEHELQSWFVKKIERHLSTLDKRLVGWDEITEGGLSKTATVMHWRGWKKDISESVLSAGNNIIRSPTTHCYFDYPHKKLPVEKVYSYQPAPANMNQNHKEQILGVQGNFWSHINRIEPEMDKQVFPRLIALSEVGWSRESNKNWDDFLLRLDQHFQILDRLDIYYY